MVVEVYIVDVNLQDLQFEIKSDNCMVDLFRSTKVFEYFPLNNSEVITYIETMISITLKSQH